MTNFDITTAWAFDGSGNNWVAYPKGYNSDGKGLENGISAPVTYMAATKVNGKWDTSNLVSVTMKVDSTYSCPGDLEGIEAEKAIKTGKYTKNTTKKAKGKTFASQNYDYVVNNTTDITGIKFCNGLTNAIHSMVIPATYPGISKEWDAEAVAKAVKDQVACFGKTVWGVGNIHTTKKVELKEAALDKSLDAAFKNKAYNTNVMSLDTTMDSDWTPVSADPMDALIEEENEMEKMMAKAKKAMTSDEWSLVIAKANGMNQTAIANEMGVSKMAISKKFKTIYKKALKATGVAFVA